MKSNSFLSFSSLGRTLAFRKVMALVFILSVFLPAFAANGKSSVNCTPASGAGEGSGLAQQVGPICANASSPRKSVILSGYTPSFSASGMLAVVCSPTAELEEGNGLAVQVEAIFAKAGLPRKAMILNVVHESTLEPFGYSIAPSKGGFTISGGGSWPMLKAAQVLADRLAASGSSENVSLKGTVVGEVLFPFSAGSNLRILDDNIWDYSSETIPAAWQQINEDCRDDVRAPQFAQIVRAYMPDVVGLQEYSRHNHERFYPLIQNYGYQIAYNNMNDPWNNTPVFYNKATLELVAVNYHLFTPEFWSNKGSKSFTSAVFKQKSTGSVFAYISTHLWWKSEKAQAGSDSARAAQIRLIIAEGEVLKAKYKCPIFVCGDMNTLESSVALQQFLQGGYDPCYTVADKFSDCNGHHICGPSDGYSRKSNRPSPTRKLGAIDHCLIYNPGATTIQNFKCDTTYFTIKLTDHYPNIVDAKL